MGFEEPLLLLLLLPVLILLYYKDNKNGIPYSPLGWVSKNEKKDYTFLFIKLSDYIFIISLIVALAEPFILVEKVDLDTRGFDLVIAMDISASMQAEDFKPNRLEAMKSMLGKFVDSLEGAFISIVVFSGKPFLHSPFTFDKRLTQKAIETIYFQTISHNLVGGTNIGDSIIFSTILFDELKYKEREKVLILLTDGENTGGIDPLLAAKDCLRNNIHFYIVGIAGLNPVPVFYRNEPFIAGDGKQLITSLDDSGLKKIADAGGGLYFRAEQESGLGEILQRIQKLEKKPITIREVQVKKSLSYYFTVITILSFCINIFYVGRFVKRPLR